MQNHLDSQRSFSAMLGADPMSFGPPGHEFTTLTSSHNNHHSPEFGHLLNANGGNPPLVNNNHNQQHNNNNNNSNTPNHNNNNADVKPKKAPPPNGKKTKGRVKIKMEFIDNKLRRYTTFSKRKTGIMKKAYELSTLTGTQVMLLVASETGHVYTFATRKLQPMITSEAGKALIQTCLNSPDPPGAGTDPQRMSATGYEETELTYAADPNASDHGDTKDGESESGSSDAEDPMKEVPPPLIPLTNGLIPANFAALFASATAGLKQSFPLDLASQISSSHLISSQQSPSSSSSSSSQSRLSQQELLQKTLLQQQQHLHQQIQLELLNEQQKLLQHNNTSSSNATTSSTSSFSINNNKVKVKREVQK
ncbi:serum response factor homolog isoform X2 [Folsomia candida]|uniref:serum response factor homolog isoform X2 n=1 Tax=Folsomia candida TaxID=158441 RepID=UPI000B908C9E|nr:serum response factor homolog isoform X2 [Folsomia candida]